MANLALYSNSYRFLSRSDSLPDHDGIFPINYGVAIHNSDSNEVLCSSVRDILQDSYQRDHALHNCKSIRGVYTNAAVAQILLSNFEPSYKPDAETRKRELIESRRDTHKFTNWCFSIKLDREPEKIKSGHQTKGVLSMRNLFEKSSSEKIKPVSWRPWLHRGDQLRASSETIETVDENLEETEIMEIEMLSRSAPKPRLISITNLDEARNGAPRRASAA